MLGAIIGDIVGSRFEWHNIKSKNFTLFKGDACFPTDDSIMTLAIARSFVSWNSKDNLQKLSSLTISYMQELGRRYPYAGYGGRFNDWIYAENPVPYCSYGNGAAMRVSPVGWVAKTPEEVKTYSEIVTGVTHNHPEGLKGAEATAMAIFMARQGMSKEEIREMITDNYYPLNFTLADIRPDYSFDVTCQGSVPQSLQAFFESVSFEDAIRNAISIGGDSDTIAAITGSIAQAYYGIPRDIEEQALEYLDDFLYDIYNRFCDMYSPSNRGGFL